MSKPITADYWSTFRAISNSRAEIAVLVWSIVATFRNDPAELYVSDMSDDEVAEWCEAYVREHAEEAEQVTIAYGRHKPSGEVIMEVLAELGLSDDYMRIKRNEQHMAFETSDGPAFTWRPTGDGIFQVDDGDTHLGTVQKFSAGVWWAYPANSAGQTQFTRKTRHEAAQALREHHTANTSVIPPQAPPACPQGHGEMVLRPSAAQTPEQRWAGTWYDCPPGPPGQHCRSSVLVPSPAVAELHESGAGE